MEKPEEASAPATGGLVGKSLAPVGGPAVPGLDVLRPLAMVRAFPSFHTA